MKSKYLLLVLFFMVVITFTLSQVAFCEGDKWKEALDFLKNGYAKSNINAIDSNQSIKSASKSLEEFLKSPNLSIEQINNAKLLLAYCYRETDRNYEAINLFKSMLPKYRYLELNLTDEAMVGGISPLCSLGYCYENVGEYEKAIEVWEEYVQYKPDSQRIHTHMASCRNKLEEQKKFRQNPGDFKKNLAEKVDKWKEALDFLKNRLPNSNIEAIDTNQSRRLASKSLEEFLKSPNLSIEQINNAKLLLAHCYEFTDRNYEAINLLKPMLSEYRYWRLDLDDEAKISGLSPLSSLGYCYNNIGEYEKAIEVCEEYVHYEPDSRAILTNLVYCRKKLEEQKKFRQNPGDFKKTLAAKVDKWKEALDFLKNRLPNSNIKAMDTNQSRRLASKSLEEFLKSSSLSIEQINNAKLLLAYCYRETDRDYEAINLLKPMLTKYRYLELNLTDEAKVSGLSPLGMLGYCYYNIGEYEKAIEVWEEFVRYKPDARVIYGHLASCRKKLEEQKKFRQNPGDFKKTLAAKFDEWNQAIEMIKNIEKSNGQSIKKAIGCLNNVLHRQDIIIDEEDYVRLLLGWCYSGNGEPDKAIEIYEPMTHRHKNLELDLSEEVKVRTSLSGELGICYERKERYEDAIKMFEIQLSDHPNAPLILVALSNCRTKLEEQKIIRQNPGNVKKLLAANFDKWNEAIEILKNRGKSDGRQSINKAIDCLNNILLKDIIIEEADYVRLLLGWCYSSNGEFDKAIEIYEPMMTRHKNLELDLSEEAGVRTSLAGSLGFCYERKERYEDAIKMFEIHLSNYPDAPVISVHLSNCRKKLAEKKKQGLEPTKIPDSRP